MVGIHGVVCVKYSMLNLLLIHFIHAYMYLCIYVYAIDTLIYRHAHTHIHTHTYTHTHTHTNTKANTQQVDTCRENAHIYKHTSTLIKHTDTDSHACI